LGIFLGEIPGPVTARFSSLRANHTIVCFSSLWSLLVMADRRHPARMTIACSNPLPLVKLEDQRHVCGWAKRNCTFFRRISLVVTNAMNFFVRLAQRNGHYRATTQLSMNILAKHSPK